MSQRKFSRAILVSSFLCVVALLVAACGGNPSTSPNTNALTPAPPDKQVLHYPIGSNDFGSLDPALFAASTDIFAVETIFTGLVEIKSDGSIVDVMAASHQVSSDGLSYTFVLKPNVTFSDGTPLTAQDVAYSVNRALLPDTKAPLASFLSAIKDFDQIYAGKVKTLIGDSIVVQDDHTLVIKLAKP